MSLCVSVKKAPNMKVCEGEEIQETEREAKKPNVSLTFLLRTCWFTQDEHFSCVISTMIFTEDESQQADKCKLRLTFLPKQLVKEEIYYCKMQSDMPLDFSIDHRSTASPSLF